jgi:tol-pal system protein YbgF
MTLRRPAAARALVAMAPRGLAAALAFSVATHAAAALFDDEEARKRIEQANQRLTQVQKQLEDRIAALEAQLKSQGLVDLFNQVEQLKADMARLRGQIEVLNHELEQAGRRQRDLYIDLDSRLRKLEGGPGAAVPPAPASGTTGTMSASGAPPVPAQSAGATAPAAPPVAAVAPPAASGTPPAKAASPAPGTPPSVTGSLGGRTGAMAADIATEQRAYDGALDQFKAGNYGAAVTGFGAFVRNYPRSPLASSAQYWLGNAQFAQKDFRAAMATQRQLLATYPDSAKVPDALLNIASCQLELGDAAGSRRTLEEIVAKHPQSEAAAKARQRLANR